MKHAIPEHVRLRPGTADHDIWHEAVELNLYKLPDHFACGDWVLDIGAHTGSVVWRCAMAGAHVVGVEPSRENYPLLLQNLAPVRDRVLTVHAAAWRNDQLPTTLTFHPNWQPCNTGGGGVLGDAGGQGCDVLAVPLDDLLRLRPEWRLLVMDCEGAEFPCLMTAARLERVREIVLEYHERGEVRPFADVGRPFTMAALRETLQGQGFTVETKPKGPGMGLLWARRKER